ncbi:Enteropeptidase [Trichinella sp. T9]|nr:Enteropeptidase [Trichinella sp. T9]
MHISQSMNAFHIILTTSFYVFCILKFDLALQSEATSICGQTAANDDGMSHYVVFYAMTEEGYFHDCMGVIADSDNNFTHSDTIITSRYCLAEGDISATKVIPLSKYSEANLSGGYKISKILIHEKNNTNSNSKSYIPNIAIIKLNQPITYTDSISPMCFPNKSDTLNEDSTCNIAEIYIGVIAPNLFTWTVKMLPHKDCAKLLNATSIDSKNKLCFTEIYGPSFQMLTIYDEDILTEGSALVCNKQGRRYLYGVRDFVKEFRKQPHKLPVVVVTFIPPYLDFIKENM